MTYAVILLSWLPISLIVGIVFGSVVQMGAGKDSKPRNGKGAKY